MEMWIALAVKIKTKVGIENVAGQFWHRVMSTPIDFYVLIIELVKLLHITDLIHSITTNTMRRVTDKNVLKMIKSMIK